MTNFAISPWHLHESEYIIQYFTSTRYHCHLLSAEILKFISQMRDRFLYIIKGTGRTNNDAVG